MTNLYARVDRMDLLEPLFMDLTWGAGGSNSDLALEIAGTVQGMCAAQMMLHLTCTNMKVADLRETLERAKKLGIRNILALRGDPPKGSENCQLRSDRDTADAENEHCTALYPEPHLMLLLPVSLCLRPRRGGNRRWFPDRSRAR